MSRSASTALAWMLSASSLTLTLAGCGGSAHRFAKPPAGTTTTSATAVPPSPQPTGTFPSDNTTGPNPTPTTTRPGGAGHPTSSTVPAGATSPQPPTPIPPGTYHYATSGSSTASGGATGSAPYPTVTTLTADQPSGSRQHTARDLRDAHGNGTLTDQILDYQADGIHLVELKVTTVEAGISYQQRFNPTPAPLVLPLQPKAGDHLEYTMANPTTSAKVSIDITGISTMTVDGTSLTTIAVRTVTTLSGEISGTTTQDSLVNPSDDLTVKEHATADGQMGLTNFHTDYTSTLQTIKPS